MKSKLILMCVVVVVLLSLVACSPAPKQVSIEVSCDDFIKLEPPRAISKDGEVAVGDLFAVTLCSSPTTGFKWELPKITDQTVLQQVDHKFEPPEITKPPKEGAAGKEVWLFKALKEGKTTISMEYSRPWEGGEKAAWTFVLTVVVK